MDRHKLRHRVTRSLRALILGAALLSGLALAGCGSTTRASSPPATATTATTPATTATATATAATATATSAARTPTTATTAPATAAPGTTAPATTAPATTATTTPPTTTSQDHPATPHPPNQLLRLGSTGAAVRSLQERLTQLGYRPGPADGSFGPATASAVLAFQKRNGLVRDAVAGPAVKAALAGRQQTGARPGPVPRIEVDVARQLVFVVLEPGSVITLNASTGTGRAYQVPGGGTAVADTPEGRFTVIRKVTGNDHSPLGTLRNPLYYYRGWAIHGSTDVPAYPASHGCARVSNADSDWLYPQVALGTPVIVYDAGGHSPAVNDLPRAATPGS